MVSNILISFLVALGAGGWIFAKFQRQTGGNTQTSLIVAGSGGLLVFLLFISILSLI